MPISWNVYKNSNTWKKWWNDRGGNRNRDIHTTTNPFQSFETPNMLCIYHRYLPTKTNPHQWCCPAKNFISIISNWLTSVRMRIYWNLEYILFRGNETSTRSRDTTGARPRPSAAGPGGTSKMRPVQDFVRLEVDLERWTSALVFSNTVQTVVYVGPFGCPRATPTYTIGMDLHPIFWIDFLFLKVHLLRSMPLYVTIGMGLFIGWRLHVLCK